MMDFVHTDEQQMLADTLSRWIERDYPLDERLASDLTPEGFSQDKWQALAELGVLGALFSEDDGGFGGSGFDLQVVFEAIGNGLLVEPLLQSAVLAGGVLAQCVSEDRKETVDAIIAGQTVGVLAHFEAEGGFDPESVATRAERSGEGWRLNGAKAVVRSAAAADFFVVSAQTESGLGLFEVPSQSGGLSRQDYQTIDGGAASEILMVDVPLEQSGLIDFDSSAVEVLTNVLGRGTLCVCAEAVGLMDTIKEMTIEFTRTRKQFGVPIGKFQALQHRMAEMLLEIEQARSAVINAAAVIDDASNERERAVSAAKYSIGRIGTLVAEEAIQMHGGIGMTWEYALGHFAKRLVMIGHEFGDEDYHLTRYINLGREV